MTNAIDIIAQLIRINRDLGAGAQAEGIIKALAIGGYAIVPVEPTEQMLFKGSRGGSPRRCLDRERAPRLPRHGGSWEGKSVSDRDPIEVMALGHCAHFKWEWERMTEQRRDMARAEMCAVVAALDAAGWAIVPKRAPDDVLWRGCEALSRASGEMLMNLYLVSRKDTARGKMRLHWNAMVDAGMVKP